jgi:hypothetical protein
MSTRANLIAGAVIGAFAGALGLVIITFLLLQITPDWSLVRDWYLYVCVPIGGLLGMSAGISYQLSESNQSVEAGYACLFGGGFTVWHFLLPAFIVSAHSLAGLIICGLPLCLGVGLIWYGYALCMEGGDRLKDGRLAISLIGGGVLGAFALALIMQLVGTWLFVRDSYSFGQLGMFIGWRLGAGLGLSWQLRANRRHIPAGCASLIIGAGVKWLLASGALLLWPYIPTEQRLMFAVLFGIPMLAAGAVAAYGCILLEPKS